MDMFSIRNCLSKIKEVDPRYFNDILNLSDSELVSTQHLCTIRNKLQELVSTEKLRYPTELMIEIFSIYEQILFCQENRSK